MGAIAPTDGSGYGYGYGYGYGDGYGDGDGSGSGYGDGYGSGSGYGYGYGYGSGSGSGSGYGYGYGDGYGDGYGSGSGYGEHLAAALAAHPRVKALTEPHVLALWRSDAKGRPTNGGAGEAVRPGLLQEIKGSLEICRRGFHGTTAPWNWTGERWWVVALFEPVQRQDDKIASLKRLIVDELV